MPKKTSKLKFIHDILRVVLSDGILVYMGLLIVVLPFYFEQGYGYIATDKATFFCKLSVNVGKALFPVLILYTITSIAVNHAKILLFFREESLKNVVKEVICKISAIDFFVGMYGVAVLLSYFCSDYRESALWGAGGWYMGFMPQMILVCGYFLIAKFWEPKKWVFYLILPVSAVVFVLGYLNRFGYYPIKMEYTNASFISTIGNINWYCGYVVTVLFLGVGLFWQGSKILGAYIFLGFATLVTQGSASGILALVVMMAVLFCLSTESAGQMVQFWKVALLMSAACLMTMIVRKVFPEAITFRDGLMDLLTLGQVPIAMTLVSCVGLMWAYWSGKKEKYNQRFVKRTAILCVTLVSCALVVYVLLLTVNTVNPGAIGILSDYKFFTFSDSWGSNRGATWRAGMLCFLEQDFLHKMVGVGPDAMGYYINSGSSEELTSLMKDNFGANLMLTNAHNEWLTVLVNYGLFGLVSFVGIIVSAVKTFLGMSRRMQQARNIATACGMGILAYTINNMFSFQQVMNVTLLFLLLGMGRAFQRSAPMPEHGKGVLQEQQVKASA